MRKLRILIIGLTVFGTCRYASESQGGIEADFLIHTDPAIVAPKSVQSFDPKLPKLWIQTLQRSENDLRRLAAESIARGHLLGVPDLLPAVPGLQLIVQSADTHPATRFAAARALIVLESVESADMLLEASQQHGSDLRQLIEPALAGWGHTAAAQIWADRLNAPSTKPRELVLAIRGLGSMAVSSALPDLVSMATDASEQPYVRLEAAAAAGQIAEDDLQQDAANLVASESALPFVDRICAVRLLARHSDPVSSEIFVKLAGYTEPSVAAEALRQLNRVDSRLVLPLAESALQNSDPKVRRQGVTAMLRLPAIDHIQPLGALLADPHPDVRRQVCEGLFRLAQTEELDAPIRQVAMHILEGDRWQGHEQASLLLGSLEHRAAADRLIELMESSRTEVRLASTWALRKLAVQSSIPYLLDLAKRETTRRTVGGETYAPGIDEQVAHIFEALGVLKAKEAEPLLMSYLPKDVRGNDLSRGAAIWALASINAGQRNPELEEALDSRINDFAPRPNEVSIVKMMSAVGLARMGAVDKAKMMKDLVAQTERPLPIQVKLALGWAVSELTGEQLPKPDPPPADQIRWSLYPLPD